MLKINPIFWIFSSKKCVCLFLPRWKGKKAVCYSLLALYSAWLARYYGHRMVTIASLSAEIFDVENRIFREFFAVFRQYCKVFLNVGSECRCVLNCSARSTMAIGYAGEDRVWISVFNKISGHSKFSAKSVEKFSKNSAISYSSTITSISRSFTVLAQLGIVLLWLRKIHRERL